MIARASDERDLASVPSNLDPEQINPDREHNIDAQLTARHDGVGVAQVSLQGVLLQANDAFCRFLKYPRDQVIGEKFQKFTHPDDLGRNLELLEGLTDGGSRGYRMEKRYVCSNGEIVWADLFVSLLQNEDGAQPRLISVITDITDHKKNEERLSFLLNEMAHRTKNLLSVVQATARQIARTSTSVQEFRTALDHRLASLSAAQDSLTHELTAGDLREVVSAQVGVFLAPNDRRIVLRGPPLRINHNAVRAIGLAICELGTNACKYGALSALDGAIDISWSTDGDQFKMAWIESNGPLVTPPSRVGFGRKVIEQMIAHSLNGTVDLIFLPQGVQWRVSTPLHHLV